MSIPRDLEVALLRSLLPGARDESRVGADVLHLAVDDVADAALVGLGVDGPRRRVERQLAERHRIRARIERAAERLAVPVELEDDMGLARAPFAAPRAFQRMAELRPGGGSNEENEKRETRDAGNAEHLRSFLLIEGQLLR